MICSTLITNNNSFGAWFYSPNNPPHPSCTAVHLYSLFTSVLGQVQPTVHTVHLYSLFTSVLGQVQPSVHTVHLYRCTLSLHLCCAKSSLYCTQYSCTDTPCFLSLLLYMYIQLASLRLVVQVRNTKLRLRKIASSIKHGRYDSANC